MWLLSDLSGTLTQTRDKCLVDCFLPSTERKSTAIQRDSLSRVSRKSEPALLDAKLATITLQVHAPNPNAKLKDEYQTRANTWLCRAIQRDTVAQ